MGKEVSTIHEFVNKSHEYGLEKETLVIRCDDGSIYEFEKASDAPSHRLVRRFKDDGTLSTSTGVLPRNVIDTLDELLGEKHWHK